MKMKVRSSFLKIGYKESEPLNIKDFFKKDIFPFLDKLRPTWKEAIFENIILGVPLEYSAWYRGITKEAVRQRRNNALKKLKKDFVKSSILSKIMESTRKYRNRGGKRREIIEFFVADAGEEWELEIYLCVNMVFYLEKNL